MEPFSLIVRLTPKPGLYEEAVALARSIVGKSEAELGCLRFEVVEKDPQGTDFYLLETWQNDAALAFHYEQDFAKHVLATFAEWMTGPPEITRVQPIR